MGINKSKYSTLHSAAKMTTTITGHPINKSVRLRFFTKTQIKRIREDPKTSNELKTMLSQTYCEFTQIRDNLYMTGVGGLTRENIREHHIKCAINVTYEAPKYWVHGIESFRIPVENTDPNISIYFDEVSELVVELAKKGKNVTFFCTDGVGRSATIVLAVLMKAFRMKLSEAYYYLYNKRQVIRPSDQNWEQLIYYEKKLFGENTVLMVDVFDSFGNLLRIPEVYL